MEADLDLADKLKPSDQELGGDDLMLEQYGSQKINSQVEKSYNNTLYASSVHDFKAKTTIDPVLHRPTTPGQLRQSIVAHTVDSLANSLAVGDMFHSQSNGFEHFNGHTLAFAASTTSLASKKSLSASITPAAKNKVPTKVSKASLSISRPKSSNRTSTADQQKRLTPVLAFGSTDALDRSIPTIIPQKATPPMKFSFSEPPRSNSSASMRSSSSSTLDLSNGSSNNHKAKKP